MGKGYIGILLIALCASGCTRTKQVDSLQKFAQNGPRTLFEVTDKEGKSWRVGSVEAPGMTTYFVISSDGRINIMATAFDDSLGAKHAVVLVDPRNKEEALAVLDRKFLSGVGNASEAYRKWLDQKAVFTYGSVQETRRFDAGKGLGSTDIRVEGTSVVGLMKHFDCQCSDVLGGVACSSLGHPLIACIDKVCDFENCLVDIINGDKSGCAQEANDAQTICEVARQ